MDQTQITSGKAGRSAKITVAICGLLLVIFAVNAFSAVLTKSATIDETVHALSGWIQLRQGDYRVQTVNPSLWRTFAALGNMGARPTLTYDSPIWTDLTWNPKDEIDWTGRMLYETPGTDGDAFVNRSRAVMLVIGVLLGVMIGLWSYQLAGGIGAVVSTTLYCFDPNFLGHSPLVKSDVAFSLALLGLGYVVWKFGQTATVFRLVAIGLICGLGINIKLSGVIAGPVLATLLLIRVWMPCRWDFFGCDLSTRWARFFTALGTGVFAALCCFAIVWAAYGFRYRPAPSPSVRMDMTAIYNRANLVETTVELKRKPTSAEIAAHRPRGTTRFVQWADRKHFLPQAMLAGLLYQSTCMQLWPAFLNGQLYGTGRWYYFPLATLYKSPVSTLVAYILTAGVLVFAALKHRKFFYLKTNEPGGKPPLLWAVACLFIPFAFFAVGVIQSHLNIGLRNALPVFPFIQIAAGCAAAWSYRRRLKFTRVILGALAIGLVTESALAWPDYIAFFNVASGGERGGLAHLGDSNLDWGQDIKSLADWQRENPGIPIYAHLFQAMEPGFYGLKYHPLMVVKDGPLMGEPASDMPMVHGVIAVSATFLQGLYVLPSEMPFYRRLRELKPMAVLGGTIYLYEYQPAK